MTRPELPSTLPVLSCRECALGKASGDGAGQFCPFITRYAGEGDEICREGEPARYVWMIKAGTAAQHQRSHSQAGVLEPGRIIGLESLVASRYVSTVRAVTPMTLCGATRDGMSQWLGSERQRMDVLIGGVLGSTDERYAATYFHEAAARTHDGGES